MRIAIVGKMRSGKDTVASLLVEKGFTPLAFADGIAEIIQKYFPEAYENGKPRKHYQHIGQELRILNGNVWINYLDKLAIGLQDIIITDCRQKNEETYLRANDYMIIKVCTEDYIRIQRMLEAGDNFTPEVLEHDTEKQVDTVVADYEISNNGTYEELVAEVHKAFSFYKSYFEPDKRYRKTLEENRYASKKLLSAIYDFNNTEQI